MKYFGLALFTIALSMGSCSWKGSSRTSDKSSSLVKISQFDRAGFCDFMIDKNGGYHAVFQESPAIGKPVFIYYSSSTDQGASWSKPVAVAMKIPESSGYARKNRTAVARLVIGNGLGIQLQRHDVTVPVLDGPGGYGIGTLFYKVLNGGTVE